MAKVLFPGTKVTAYDSASFVRDDQTPAKSLYKRATVVRWYGYVSEYMEREYGREAAKYPDLVDVVFDDAPNRISHGHFSSGVFI